MQISTMQFQLIVIASAIKHREFEYVLPESLESRIDGSSRWNQLE